MLELRDEMAAAHFEQKEKVVLINIFLLYASLKFFTLLEENLMSKSVNCLDSSTIRMIESFKCNDQTKNKILVFLLSIQLHQGDPSRLTLMKPKLVANRDTTLAQLHDGSRFWKPFPFLGIDSMQPFRVAIGQLTKQVIARYCPKFEGILEVGAGELPLADDLPGLDQTVKDQIHISDVAPQRVNHFKKSRPSSTVMELDLLEISNKIPARTYQCLVMRDVLSVLTYNDLDTALKEAACVLKENGVLIHFLFQEPFSIAALDSMVPKNRLFFPGTTENDFFTVDKTEFQERLKQRADLDPVKKVLTTYFEMGTAEKEEFCTTYSSPGRREALRYLTDCLKELECTSLKPLNLVEDFASHALASLDRAGFEVMQNKNMVATAIVPRNQLHDNPFAHLFSIDKGVRAEHFLGVLAAGMVQVKSIAHVIVAQKRLQI